MWRSIIPVLCLFCVGASPFESTYYRVRVHTDLEFERWNSGYGHTVDMADVVYRLQLNIIGPASSKRRSSLDLDLLAGSDIGPPKVISDIDPERRTSLLVYRAQWRIENIMPATRLTVGRQIYWDLIGMGGLDGASVRVQLPERLSLNLRGGWSLRNEWSPLSPVLLQPLDGGQAHAGYLISAGLDYQSFTAERAGLQYRRVFDADVESEEIGWGARWQPFEELALEYLGIADIVYTQLAETDISIITRLGGLQGTISGRYVRPRFAHHTIWHAFAPAPFHSVDTELSHRSKRLHFSLGGDLRQYQGSMDSEFGLMHLNSNVDDRSYGLRSAINYSPDSRFEGRQIGLFARGTDGFGGRYGTLALRWFHPVKTRIRGGHLSIDAQIGMSYFEQDVTRLFAGHTAWTRWAFPWRLREGLFIEGSMDSIFGPNTPKRTRFGLSMRAETWW